MGNQGHISIPLTCTWTSILWYLYSEMLLLHSPTPWILKIMTNFCRNLCGTNYSLQSAHAVPLSLYTGVTYGSLKTYWVFRPKPMLSQWFSYRLTTCRLFLDLQWFSHTAGLVDSEWEINTLVLPVLLLAFQGQLLASFFGLVIKYNSRLLCAMPEVFFFGELTWPCALSGSEFRFWKFSRWQGIDIEQCFSLIIWYWSLLVL